MSVSKNGIFNSKSFILQCHYTPDWLPNMYLLRNAVWLIDWVETLSNCCCCSSVYVGPEEPAGRAGQTGGSTRGGQVPTAHGTRDTGNGTWDTGTMYNVHGTYETGHGTRYMRHGTWDTGQGTFETVRGKRYLHGLATCIRSLMMLK